MEKEIKTATLTDEDGVEYELEVIKEFDYKDKKYAVLYEDGCNCDDECDCNDECDCDDECSDDCECTCHDEENDHIYILEVKTDEKGNAVYNEIDENLMQELIPIVEKELYPTEE